MISYNCPVCKTENRHDLAFSVQDYVCKSCGNIINTSTNTSRGVIKKPITNVVLEVGMKGKIDGKEYSVVAIVVKKYGASIYWREYYLKDNLGNNAFLSESDGHWVFLLPKEKKVEDFKYFADFDGKKYRWYETTPCNTHSAVGFFEDKLNLKLSTYKEFVNGTEMVSWEENGDDREFFWGKHIPKSEIKENFKPSYMPNYFGIGIVQPFYFNMKQVINILGITALLISLLQIFVLMSRRNNVVLDETVAFADLKDKEYVSKTFELSGGSAPLEVKASSEVDNSWANIELSLVNEKTNEVTYTSQDIEYYHGYEDGESWSEGSRKKDFNFCGVAPGKYHFLISAEKETSTVYPSSTESVVSSGTKSVKYRPDGMIEVFDNSTGNIVTYDIINTFRKDSINSADFEKIKKQQDSANVVSNINNNEPKTVEINPDNQNIIIKAKWLPVSLWNFGIVFFTLVAMVVGAYWWKYLFEKSKWSNSSNTPYPESEEE